MQNKIHLPEKPRVNYELAALVGARSPEWSAQPLAYNARNAVTVGIWRIRAAPLSAVLKVISRSRVSPPEQWSASAEPSHWNFWEREALAYEHGVVSAYAEAGISPPRLLALSRRPDENIALWLEDAQSAGTVPGPQWKISDYARFAHRLGLAQGRLATTERTPNPPWLSRRFLREYVTSKRDGWGLLDSDEAWRQPLVRDYFPDGLRKVMVGLHAKRDWLFALMERLPRALCHLDVWPNNLFARPDGSFVLVDWAFVGDGAIGEDIGNLIPDSVFDLFVPARLLPRLDRAIFDGYLAGLREAGWDGDERLVRLGMCASAVKYDWLVVGMLMVAENERQMDYGGRALVDVRRRYEERGAALAFLGSWIEEAQELNKELGVYVEP